MLKEARQCVESYFSNSSAEKNYIKLLDLVRSTCNDEWRNIKNGMIYRIYDRRDKQDAYALKTNEKIAIALVNIAKQQDKKPKDISIDSITDIIGITIVTHYHDHIDFIANKITNALKSKRIICQKPKKIEKNGYHATHIVTTSDMHEHRGKSCEIQIKSVLNDVWSARTHDLTYKPLGLMDPRIKKVFEAFGDALDAIEKQSALLREMIEEQWRSEFYWRNEVRKELLESIPVWSIHGKIAKRIKDKIDREKSRYQFCAITNNKLQNIFKSVDHLEKKSPREAYIIRAYLALLRGDEGEIEKTTKIAKDWMRGAIELLQSKKIDEYELWSIPLVLLACDKFEDAIESSDEILSRSDLLTEYSRAAVKFNKADLLLWNAMQHRPTNDDELEKLKTEIELLIADSKILFEKDDTPYLDAIGMIEVIFSNQPSKIRNGIRNIQKASDNASTEDKRIAEATLELHSRYAWRRLMEIEAKQT